MGISAALEFVCHICNQPITLATDLATNESGQSLHGHCYAKQIQAEAGESAIRQVSTLSADSTRRAPAPRRPLHS